ncbi:OmpA family protein [Pseudaestuariivita atlantica]|uniref:Membrane protein n=1 Tax=Pseudaestuariivita atlantica TaxID=1317121 RepID=A0A0L1JNR5_9RHOB|nr:OmpA family protein [Pseudaestuariivita atlantica]KNG93357.1 membrane protein [Pseudaestuariivita atlantica]
MFRAPKSIVMGVAALSLVAACTDPASVDGTDPNAKAKQGALLGAAAGAVLGVISGDDPKERRQNAIKGAAIGAAGGALIGNQLDKQEADLRRDLGNSEVKIVNTGDRLIVTMPNDILFATDSASVRSDLQRDLRAVAGNLQAYPNTTVQVVGHTDSTGSSSYNYDLSERRANAVAAVLTGAGVPASRIRTFGRGEDQPVASNGTAEGRAQNRRVEIVILPNT